MYQIDDKFNVCISTCIRDVERLIADPDSMINRGPYTLTRGRTDQPIPGTETYRGIPVERLRFRLVVGSPYATGPAYQWMVEADVTGIEPERTDLRFETIGDFTDRLGRIGPQ